MEASPEVTLARKSENSSVSATRARQTARKCMSACVDDAVLLICIWHRYNETSKKEKKQAHKDYQPNAIEKHEEARKTGITRGTTKNGQQSRDECFTKIHTDQPRTYRVSKRNEYENTGGKNVNA